MLALCRIFEILVADFNLYVGRKIEQQLIGEKFRRTKNLHQEINGAIIFHAFGFSSFDESRNLIHFSELPQTRFLLIPSPNRSSIEVKKERKEVRSDIRPRLVTRRRRLIRCRRA